MKHKIVLGLVIVISVIAVGLKQSAAQYGQTWYVGTWDSSLHAWSTAVHPRTIGIRFEIIDSRSRMPITNANITLKGFYNEEHMGEHHDLATPRRQRREYELSAFTQEEGIAVFALSWLKEYPWSLERPKIRDPNVVSGSGSWQYARSWVRPVDDIEKVRIVEIRHPRYHGIETTLDFGHLLQFGQDEYSEFQSWEINDRFENAWRSEIDKPGARYCVLTLGEDFPEFGNQICTRLEFFDKIRQKDYGTVLEEQSNITYFRPEIHSGPYLIYVIRLEMKPIRR